MYNDFEIIANNIKYLREKKGYTQEQLAEATGLSVSHISKVEAGVRRVGMKAYISILEALGAGAADYATFAIKDESEEYLKRYIGIISDCNDEEKTFLLNTLEAIKMNLKKFQDETCPA